MANFEEIPPPRNEPVIPVGLQIGLTPEQFEPLKAQFLVDLAKILGVPPDDIEIVSATRANPNGSDINPA